MNDSQAKQFTLNNPQAFEEWVRNTAAINEQFAEVLHNSADIIAIVDPRAAIGLYQAADVANRTVHHLRMAIPPPTPAPPPAVVVVVGDPKYAWLSLGFLCGYLLSLV